MNNQLNRSLSFLFICALTFGAVLVFRSVALTLRRSTSDEHACHDSRPALADVPALSVRRLDALLESAKQNPEASARRVLFLEEALHSLLSRYRETMLDARLHYQHRWPLEDISWSEWPALLRQASACVDGRERARGSMAPLRIAVCTMMRGESRDILEWLLHHTLIGVQRFFILDDTVLDEDGEAEARLFRARLRPFERIGLVERYTRDDAPRLGLDQGGQRYDQNRQMWFFSWCSRAHADNVDWMLNIDSDEYVVMPAPNAANDLSSLPCLDEWLHAHTESNVPMISVGRRRFGSSNVSVAHSDRLIMEQFFESQTSPAIKSFVRPAAIQTCSSAHYCTPSKLWPQQRSVYPSGRRAPYKGRRWKGDQKDLALACIHHYKTRSVEDCLFKVVRGYHFGEDTDYSKAFSQVCLSNEDERNEDALPYARRVRRLLETVAEQSGG